MSFRAIRTLPAIDAIRFVCAVWVALSHLGPPPLDVLLKGIGPPVVETLVRQFLNVAFCGPAAVMVFFTVSGFCIHARYAAGGELAVGPFYLSRLTRITVPLVAAVVIFKAFGVFGGLDAVLWSIYCEIAYYLLYPPLLLVFRKFGVRTTVWGSFGLSLTTLAIVKWPDSQSWRVNLLETTVLLYPVWLLGCLLAEKMQADALLEAAGKGQLVTFRVIIIALSMLALVLQFHSPIGYRDTMPLFSLPAFAWMFLELKYASPPAWLASSGKACYSMYLMHVMAIPVVAALCPGAGPWIIWPMRALAVAVFTTAFYFVVERPSHQFARRLGRMKRQPLLPCSAP